MATDFFRASPHILAESQPRCVSVRSASHTTPQVFIHKQLVGLVAAENLSFTKWCTASSLITPPVTWLRPLSPTPLPHHNIPPSLTAEGKKPGRCPSELIGSAPNFSQILVVSKKERKGRQVTLSFHDNNNFCCGTCIRGRWRLRSLKINKQSHLLDAGFVSKLRKLNCSF